MKKLLCLLLALVMVLSLAACAGRDDEDEEQETVKEDETTGGQEDDKETEPTLAEELQGTWVIYVYMTEENLGLEGFNSDAGLPIAFTFHEDGTYLQVPYEAEIDDAIAAMEEDLVDYIVDMAYDMMADEGYTKADADEMFELLYGMSIRAFAEEEVKGADMASMAEQRNEGEYTLEGDQLYLAGREETLTIAIEGDTLTILDCDDADSWESLFGEFPIELKRVD